MQRQQGYDCYKSCFWQSCTFPLSTEPQLQLREKSSEGLLCCRGKPGWLQACRPSYPTGIALGKSHLICIFSSVSTMKWQESFSRVNKSINQKTKKKKIAKTKNLLGVAALFIDKLNTEMQTTGTSKAVGNQQLQKMQLFLQSLVRRRGEMGS